MAIVFADSLQQYAQGNINTVAGFGTGGWRASSSSLATISALNGRWGGKTLRLDSSSADTDLWATVQRGVLNFAWFPSNVAAGLTTPIAQMMLNQVAQCCITPNANGGLDLRRGGGTGTILQSSRNGVLTGGTNFFFEWMFDIDPAAGKSALYVNNEELFNLTGLNIRGAATNDVNQFLVQCPGSNQRYYGEFYCSDTYVRLGERKFERLLPNANTAVNDFVPLAGNAWDAVNDADADGDTTYVAAGTVGNASMFALNDLSNTPVTIETVIARICARKDDAAARALKIALGDGSNTIRSADKNMAASYAHFVHQFTTAPDGGAWSAAKLNALLAGAEVSV